MAFVEAYQADIYRGRTDYFHGKAPGDITAILLGRWFVAFSLALQGGLMFSFDTSGLLFSLCLKKGGRLIHLSW